MVFYSQTGLQTQSAKMTPRQVEVHASDMQQA